MAAIGVKINKQDMNLLVKKITELKQLSKQDLADNIAHAAMSIANDAAQEAPVYKGNKYVGGTLRQNIGSEAKGNTAVIYAKTKYAAYQEFGTGRYVDVSEAEKVGIPASEIKRLYKGEGKRKVNIHPQPYFFPAVRRGLKRLLDGIQRDINKITK